MAENIAYNFYFYYYLKFEEENEEIIDDPSSIRDFLDMYEPLNRHNLLFQGANELKNKIEDTQLSQNIDYCISNSSNMTNELKLLWDGLDYYDKYGMWDTAVNAFLSKEVVVGGAIGSMILPGIGTAIGGALGGMLSGKKEDDVFDANFDIYNNNYDNYISTLESDFNTYVLPLITKKDIANMEGKSSWGLFNW